MWTRDNFIAEDARDRGEAGLPFSALSNAVQLIDCMHDQRLSIAEIARRFNCTPALIADAVREHYWMALEDSEGRLIDGFNEETGRHSIPTGIDDFEKVFIWHEGE